MRVPGSRGLYLFSVDLEDPRSLLPDGGRYEDRVAANVERYLAFLSSFEVRCTFFTVGEVARRVPGLVRRIVDAGHEIACHSSEHVTLDQHTPASFRDDLEACLADLGRAGAPDVRGFRAPVFSLTRETAWAHDVLASLDFEYSSSVLPAASPLFGWPEFGGHAIRTDSGILEIPISVTTLPGLRVPYAGGVYFRALPFGLIRHFFRRGLDSREPVVGYFHPYDVDESQERYVFAGMNGNRFYNWLMYYNRTGVFPRLEKLLRAGADVLPYRDFAAGLGESSRAS